MFVLVFTTTNKAGNTYNIFELLNFGSIFLQENGKANLILGNVLKMGIIVSKENRNRTKKVQQTAAVVTALKLASKESKGKGSPSNSPTASQALGIQTGHISQETKHDTLSNEHHDFEREHTENLNNDRSSITYGLPELDGADSLVYSSGTTGYWDKTDKAVVSTPYFGAWKHRVCSS